MKIKYIGRQKIVIPRLKSKGGAELRLPLIDYKTGKRADMQEIEVSDQEAGDLMRTWKGSFIVPKKKKESEVNIDG
jgi:hypothetical protein